MQILGYPILKEFYTFCLIINILQLEDVSLKVLQDKGVALSRLIITERSTGLFGRATISLASRPHAVRTSPLPSHSFSPGIYFILCWSPT